MILQVLKSHIAHVFAITSLLLGIIPAIILAAPQQSDVDRLQATKMCGEKVAVVGPKLISWKKEEGAKAGLDSSTITFTFSGHFNGELKRCLVEVKMATAGEWGLVVYDTYDAFEGQQVGSLMTSRRKTESDDTVLGCKVLGEEVEGSACRSLMRK